MKRSKLELDRCILFPRAEGAVSAIERSEIDSRFEIEVIDVSYSSLSKLELFGFFSYPINSGLNIAESCFVKVPSKLLPLVIDTALKSRKEMNDKELLRLIDSFVEKAKRSSNQGLPIWFNT